jgi:hypothetical protein
MAPNDVHRPVLGICGAQPSVDHGPKDEDEGDEGKSKADSEQGGSEELVETVREADHPHPDQTPSYCFQPPQWTERPVVGIEGKCDLEGRRRYHGDDHDGGQESERAPSLGGPVDRAPERGSVDGQEPGHAQCDERLLQAASLPQMQQTGCHQESQGDRPGLPLAPADPASQGE